MAWEPGQGTAGSSVIATGVEFGPHNKRADEEVIVVDA